MFIFSDFSKDRRVAKFINRVLFIRSHILVCFSKRDKISSFIVSYQVIHVLYQLLCVYNHAVRVLYQVPWVYNQVIRVLY